MWTIVSGLMFWGGGTFFSWSRVIINFFKKKIDSQGNRTTFETSNYSVMLSNENQTGINAWLDPKWITWCHLLAIFSTLQFLRFVFQCMMETNILKYALIGKIFHFYLDSNLIDLDHQAP